MIEKTRAMTAEHVEQEKLGWSWYVDITWDFVSEFATADILEVGRRLWLGDAGLGVNQTR